MDADPRAFIAACQVWKASNQPPAGLLCLLAVHRPPWSHTAVDFVIRLHCHTHHIVGCYTEILLLCCSFEASFCPRDSRSLGEPYFQAPWNSLRHCIGLGPTGRHFVQPSGRQSACPLDSIWKQMDKQSGQTRIWKLCEMRNGQNPASWNSHLVWIEYAHTPLSSSATGMTGLSALRDTFPLCSQYLLCKIIKCQRAI